MIKLDKIFNPKVLSALAVAGVVATAVMAALEGINGSDVIREAKKTAPKEGIWAISKHYIPRVVPAFGKTIIIGGVTVFCVVTSCYLSGLQIVALSGTIAGLVTQRDAVEKEIVKLPGGKEALAKVKKEVALATAEKKIAENEKSKPWKYQTIEDTGNGDELFIDEWSGRMFWSSEEAVRRGFDNFNAERDDGMDLPYNGHSDMNIPPASSYNKLYEAWDLAPNGLGWTFGWPASDDYYEHRSIPYTIEVIPVEEMKDKELKRLGKDLHIIRIPEGYYPMECYLEV